MFAVLISCRLSGRDGQRSLGCNVSVWPETMWEREHSPRFHCHGTLPQTTGRLPRAPEPERWQRLSPVEHLCVGYAGPRKSLCHWWSSASNIPLLKQTKQQKDNPLEKEDNLYVSCRLFYSPRCLPPLIPCISFPSERWRDFPWHLNWKEWPQPIHQKNVVKNWIWLLGKEGSLII